jgi:hypothetical protein
LLPVIPLINSSPPSEVSVYSSVYNHGQPDYEQAKQIRQETFQRFSTTQTRRSQLQKIDQSFNVASCLVWNNSSIDENTKSKNFLAPISIKSRHSFHSMPSAHQPILRPSESTESIRSIEQPYSDTNTFGDRYNFTKESSPRLASSLDQAARTNSVECLISKYM